MTRWQRPPGVLWRWNGHRVVVLPAGADEAALLDGVGAWIWGLLETAADQATLTTQLSEMFKIPEEQIEADVTSMLADLQSSGVVMQTPEGP